MSQIEASKPSDIYFGNGKLSKRQEKLLDKLDSYGSQKIVRKRDIKLKDLAALTAQTGDEFAIFTRGSQRMIVRGGPKSVPIDTVIAKDLSSQGWRFSSHSHPGASKAVLQSSIGDRSVLEAFGGEQSSIVNSVGEHRVYNPYADNLSEWLP